MQPGAPGRSSSVSERRPRRGGGGGGDGGGGGGAPPPDRALPAREAAFGRRVQQRQRPPRPISRVRVHAAARIRAATRAAARGAKAESEGHVPSPLGLRDEGKAERHLPCRGGAVRRRRGGGANVQVYTSGCRWGWPAWRVIAARSPSSRHRTRGRSPRVAWGWKPRPAVHRYGATGRRRRALTTVDLEPAEC